MWTQVICQLPETLHHFSDRGSSLHFNGFKTRVSRHSRDTQVANTVFFRFFVCAAIFCHLQLIATSVGPYLLSLHTSLCQPRMQRELEIEGLVDLPALRKLRRSHKGQLTKLEKDLQRYRDQPLEELKRPTLECMLPNYYKQHLFYTLIQDRILYLLHDHTTGVITEEEEME